MARCLDVEGRWTGSRREGRPTGPAPGRCGNGRCRAAARAPWRSRRSRGRRRRAARPATRNSSGSWARAASSCSRSATRGVHRDGGVGRLAPLVGQVGQWSPAPAPQLVEAGVGGHPVGPGRKRRPAVEAGQAPHDGEERLLRGVGGVGVVAGDAPGQGVDAVVVLAQQLLEGRSVAVPGRRHQVLRRIGHVTAISEICSCHGRWHGATLWPRDGDEEQHVAPRCVTQREPGLAAGGIVGGGDRRAPVGERGVGGVADVDVGVPPARRRRRHHERVARGRGGELEHETDARLRRQVAVAVADRRPHGVFAAVGEEAELSRILATVAARRRIELATAHDGRRRRRRGRGSRGGGRRRFAGDRRHEPSARAWRPYRSGRTPRRRRRARRRARTARRSTRGSGAVSARPARRPDGGVVSVQSRLRRAGGAGRTRACRRASPRSWRPRRCPLRAGAPTRRGRAPRCGDDRRRRGPAAP